MKTVTLLNIALFVFILPFTCSSQLVSVAGNVFNEETGQALKDVNIFEKGSMIGTITNEKGYFRIVLTQGEKEINITDSGFEKYFTRLQLDKDTTIVVKLSPERGIKEKRKKQPLHAVAHNQEIPDSNTDRHKD